MKIKNLNDSELVKLEKSIRNGLATATSTPEVYARHYKAWFMLREAGVVRGVFQFFVPSNKE
jgi:hypothetical protein